MGEYNWLVVTGTMEFGLTFPSYWEWNVIIPSDVHELIFFRVGSNHRPEKHAYHFFHSAANGKVMKVITHIQKQSPDVVLISTQHMERPNWEGLIGKV